MSIMIIVIQNQTNKMTSSSNAHLNDFGANLKGAGAEFLTGAVCILSVHHTDVSTASGRDHLQARHGDKHTD